MVESLAQSLGPLGPTNFLKYALYLAAQRGVAWETLVILLLFPLVVAVIAAGRHFIGLRGFGIFTSAMLAVAFLVTGIIQGSILFVIILSVATGSRLLIKKLKIHYLARMALLVWFICLGVFVSLFWLKASIFPILILILLAETFLEVQIGKSLREAVHMAAETFILALACWWLMSWRSLQQMVFAQPEIIVLGTAILDILIGKYTGLRLLEYRRFRKLLK